MNHPNEARAIVARYLGDEAITLTDYTFDVHLRQNLLIDLESQARWAITNRLTDRQEVPNFLPLLYVEGLRGCLKSSDCLGESPDHELDHGDSDPSFRRLAQPLKVLTQAA